METGCWPVFVFLLGEKMTRRTARRKPRGGPASGRPWVPKKGPKEDPKTRERQRALVHTVNRLADPLCRAEGMELVHVEYQREPGGLTLRIYLDKPGGVTLGDCADISRQLSDILDLHLQDTAPYRLEVSSPGIDRPVGKLEDFMRFRGYRAKIRMATPVNGRKNFTGVLAGVVGETIQLALHDETVSLNIKEIIRTRLINYNGER